MVKNNHKTTFFKKHHPHPHLAQTKRINTPNPPYSGHPENNRQIPSQRSPQINTAQKPGLTAIIAAIPLPGRNMTAKLTVLISGGGSNLAALLAACATEQLLARITRVIADRDCAGKQHALARDIPFHLIDRKLPDFAARLAEAVPADSDLIILAGFLSIFPSVLIDKHPGKIINLHPSLLPAYGGAGMYGLRVHEAVIAAGETESGCTVHYVDHGIDTGKIIAQTRTPVLADDDARSLQARIAPLEHQLLIRTVAQLLDGSTH